MSHQLQTFFMTSINEKQINPCREDHSSASHSVCAISSGDTGMKQYPVSAREGDAQ